MQGLEGKANFPLDFDAENTPSYLTDTDVMIIGAGPTGLSVALLMAARGHSVAVYERWGSPYPLPRAIAMSHDSVRTYQSIGLLPRLREIAEIGTRDAIGQYLNATGEVLFSDARYPRAAASGFPTMIGFHQPAFEALLETCCNEHPNVVVHRGWDLREIEQSESAVVASLAPVDGEVSRDGCQIKARARYLIGCDGANSTTRSLSGISVTDTGFSSSWLVVDLVSKIERTWVPELGQILDPARPTTAVPGGPGRRRFEMMALPGETAETFADADAVWRLLGKHGVLPENADLIRFAFYTFRGRWADRWRDHRILLAGDAAHQMPPFLGQGFNSGIRDAIALAWRLSLVIEDKVPSTILDSYGEERLPHVRQIVEQAVEIGKMICITDPVAAEHRDAVLRGWQQNPDQIPMRPTWRLGPGILSPDDPSAGTLGVQGRVEANGRRDLLDDIFGGGRFALLGNRIDPTAALSPEARTLWATLGGISVAIGGEVADIDGSYAEWFAALGQPIVLVRPDFTVYGSATINGLNALVKKLGSQLGIVGKQA